MTIAAFIAGSVSTLLAVWFCLGINDDREPDQ